MIDKTNTVESVLQGEPIDRFRKLLFAMHFLEVMPETAGASSLFLTYRGGGAIPSNGMEYNQRSTFLSPGTFRDFRVLYRQWSDADKKKALNLLGKRPGCEAHVRYL